METAKIDQVQLMERILQAKLDHVMEGELVIVQFNSNLTMDQIQHVNAQLEEMQKITGVEFIVLNGDVMLHKDESELKKLYHLIGKRIAQLNKE